MPLYFDAKKAIYVPSDDDEEKDEDADAEEKEEQNKKEKRVVYSEFGDIIYKTPGPQKPRMAIKGKHKEYEKYVYLKKWMYKKKA